MVKLKGEEKRRYVAGLFTRISGRYDLMNTLMTWGMDGRWRRWAAQRAMQDLEGPALDVATGTGELALKLSGVKGVTRVVGLDLLEPMVSRAARKPSRARHGVAVNFMVGDALTLPFPDDTFACVTSAFSLRNVPNLEASLQEMVRVVRPGGRVLSLETMLADKDIFRPMVRLYFRTVVPLFGSLVAGDRSAYAYLSRSMAGFQSAQGLARLLQEIGLKEVAHQPLALGSVHLHWGTKGT